MRAPSLAEKIQRALDIAEVQNVMSKHAYYHGAGHHLQELSDIWVEEDGDWATTASFGQNHGYWVGMERIRKYYGELNETNRKRNLGRVCQLHPEVENTKKNEGVGSLIMHTLTTPIIEVAGDGRTAKGMWYSPGQVTEVGPDGKPIALWMWEKYGVDFVRRRQVEALAHSSVHRLCGAPGRKLDRPGCAKRLLLWRYG